MSPNRLARLLAERLEEEGKRAGAALTVGELLRRFVPYEVARRSLELTTKSEYDLLVLEFLADRRLTVLRDPAVAEAAREELDTPEPDLSPLEEHADVALRLDLATISGGYRSSGPGEAAGDGAPDEPGPGTATEGGGSAADEAPTPDEARTADDAADGDGGGEDEPTVGAAWDPTGGVEARPVPEEPEGPGRDADESAPAGRGAAGAPRGRGGRSAPAEGRPDDDGACRSCGRPFPRDVDVPVRFCPHCGTSRPDRSCPDCGTSLQPDWSFCPACGAQA